MPACLAKTSSTMKALTSWSRGGQAIQITRSGGAAAQESPNGSYIYYVKEPGPPRMFRMPVEGGEEKQVLPDRATLRWAFGKTGKGVYFALRNANTIGFLRKRPARYERFRFSG